jgi:hypothetical protein
LRSRALAPLAIFSHLVIHCLTDTTIPRGHRAGLRNVFVLTVSDCTSFKDDSFLTKTRPPRRFLASRPKTSSRSRFS